MRINKNLDKIFQEKFFERTAKISISSSSLRNQGDPGTIANVRKYLLQNIKFNKITKYDELQFNMFLDKHTSNIQLECFKTHDLYWGSSRKAINIFLRDSLYFEEINKIYKLDRIKKYFEIPIDRNVFSAIKYLNGINNDVKWKSIKSLTPSENQKLQSHALNIARGLEMERVDLDVFFWIIEEDKKTLKKIKQILQNN